MDQGNKLSRKSNPKEKANIFSLITFFYIAKTFFKGFRKDLEEDDIFEVLQKLKSKQIGDRLEKEWDLLKKQSRKPTVLNLLWTCYGRRWLLYGCIEMFSRTSLGILIPFATGKLVQYFIPGQTEMNKHMAVTFALVVIVAKVFDSICYHNYILILTELSTLVKTACCSLIYRKSLTLSPKALSDHNTGSIVTLMTKDVQYIDTFMQYGNEFWIAVFSSIITTGILYMRIGFAAVAGIGILTIVVPLQVFLGNKMGAMRMKTSQKTDVRLQETQEILSSIKILKMYTWELIFAERVSVARKEEVIKLRRVFFIKALSFCIGFLCSYTSFYVLLLLYVNFSDNVTAENLFFMIGTFDYIKFSIAMALPHSISTCGEMFAALRRIGNLLEAEELPANTQEDSNGKVKVSLNGVSFRIKDKTILKSISCTISRGLNVITGPVGSGKSSILKVILRDYPISEGDLHVSGNISYVSQEPWLFPATIRQNILFGTECNEDRYQKILDVCALRYDLDLLVNRDDTVVGDHGSNLSKGQQARVSLARAVYRDCDIYLLDDCLASLDTKVQEHIFQKCIKHLLSDKIVLFVTHSLKYIEQSDNIIIMSDGEIKSVANPQNINDLIEYVEADSKKSGKEKLNQTDILEEEEDESAALIKNGKIVKEQNIYREKKKKGSVGISIYLKYFKFGGGIWFLILVLSLYATHQFTTSFLDKTLTTWVDTKEEVEALKKDNKTNTTEFSEKIEESQFLWSLYSTFIIVASVALLIRSFIYYIFVSKMSINIHKNMIMSVVNATMEFFDNTFIGNILNRFSRDLATIDEQLPFVLDECLHVTTTALGVFALVASVNQYFLISAGAVLIVLGLLAKFYLPTGRSLKRLDSATRSPMVGHINSTLEGLTTIRAFRNQKIVQDEFDRHQDLYTSAYHMSLVTTRAFAAVVDVVSLSYIISVITHFIIYENVMAGAVGLALTQAFKFTGVLQWGVFQWASLENQMTSVERVLEYTAVPSENKKGLELPNWPKDGGIIYDSVSLIYEKTKETVLRNINLKIPPGSKIGIVGRTGAGKSSLIGSLFRLYSVEGRIFVDGIDIKTVALEYLRSKIVIIPQDPLLFRGTVRYNIDPENKYEDGKIWRSLEIVHLKDFISDLNLELKDKDSLFSAGQRQLVCLARALVRDARIIVLDEATASLDPEIDVLIHEIISSEFKDCTVLTIAHKLDSILHVDKVVVLEKGEVVEFDSPKVLLSDKASLFSTMLGKKDRQLTEETQTNHSKS